MSEISSGSLNLSRLLAHWQDEHPYIFSGVIAFILIIWMIFFTPFLDISDEEISSPENIEFINIETLQSARRITKQDIESDSSNEKADVQRAVGTTSDTNAVDISFYPNIAPPRPVGRLKKYYPNSARELNVEAVVNVEILISSEGNVKNVRILGIRLSKSIPADISSRLMQDFSNDARRILMGARFTPPVVEGKHVPIKMEMPLRFRLE